MNHKVVSYANTAIQYLTLAEAKAELNIYSSTDDDTIITRYINQSVSHLSQLLGYSLRKATVSYYFGANEKIFIPAKVLSITNVKYRNSSNTLTTMTSGTDYDAPIELVADYGTEINIINPPSSLHDYDWVYKVTVVEGFEIEGTSTDESNIIPLGLKGVIAHLTTHYYTNRSPVVVGVSVDKLPFNFESVLFPYRILQMI